PTSASHHLDQRGFNSHHSSNSPFRGPASQTPLNYSSIANGQTAPTGGDDIDGGGAAGAIHMQQTHKYSPGVAIPTLTVDDVVEDLGFGMYQVKIVALAGLAWMAESMMVNVLGVLGPEIYCKWQLSADAEAAIAIAGFLGLMLGCMFFGMVFDRFGRRFGMLLSVGWSAVFCLITAFSTRYVFLVINVFLMNFGAGASSLAAVYSTEFIPVRMRSTAICIMNFFWAGGASLTSLIALIFLGSSKAGDTARRMTDNSGWRSLIACCSIPLFLFVALAYKHLPESPRFSMTKGNPIEASIVLKKFADENKRNCPVGNLAADQISSQGSLRSLINSYTWRKTTVGICTIVFVVRFCYYGTILQTTEIFQEQDVGSFCDLQGALGVYRCNAMCKRLHSHDYVDLLLTTLAEFPGLVVTYFIVDRYGRRLSLAAVLAGMAFGYSILFICPGRQLTDAAFFIARALAISSFNTIVLYGAEIYPTNMRATGLGFCSFVGGCGMLLVPIVTEIISKTSSRLATTIFVGLASLGAFTALSLPLETSGLKLGQLNL
ncbi:synaptic vesicle 2-related protein-like, partial [Convolutriloba macropyga]|uniref:synaptic vesicle 2-related protein-like n=1 Tax=Convolutriloba macropyga TaxID=536237 RepID=UPI003F51C9FD